MALQAEHGLSADASVLYTTEELATALAKFETFHKLEPGRATAEQLQRSSAQIGGWLKASLPALEAKAAAAATSVQSAARRRAAIKVKRVLEAEKRRGKSIEAVHEQVNPALKIAPKTIELLHSHITSTLDNFVEDMAASKKEEGVRLRLSAKLFGAFCPASWPNTRPPKLPSTTTRTTTSSNSTPMTPTFCCIAGLKAARWTSKQRPLSPLSWSTWQPRYSRWPEMRPDRRLAEPNSCRTTYRLQSAAT